MNWKSYFRSKIAPYIKGDVAEVGAGIGSNTALLMSERVTSWISLEPDAKLAREIEDKCAAGILPKTCVVRAGFLSETPQQEAFDTIIYIDVLEHIKNDQKEVSIATSRLRPGGRLVVLAPAHQFLYTPFDRAIGHYRRYSARTLAQLGSPPLNLERSFYLDSVGSLASLANKLVLKSSHPSARQIRFWDSVLVPVSRLADPLSFFRIGKTVVVIWKKPT